MMKTVTLLVLALGLSACAPLPLSRGEPGGSNLPGTDSTPESEAAPTRAPSTMLLEQSRGHIAAGEYPEAAASLERAVRIAPGDPWLWLELARVHFAAGDTRQAEAHARKALSLAGGDSRVSRAARKLLDRIGAG